MNLFDFLVYVLPDRRLRLKELPTQGDGRLWWLGAAVLAIAALLALLQIQGAGGR